MVAPFQRNWVTFPELGGKGGSDYRGCPKGTVFPSLFLGERLDIRMGYICPDRELLVYPKDGNLVHLGPLKIGHPLR